MVETPKSLYWLPLPKHYTSRHYQRSVSKADNEGMGGFGIVILRVGGLLGGIKMEAFGVDNWISMRRRTAIPDAAGRYVLGQLVGGEYVVGVNARAD